MSQHLSIKLKVKQKVCVKQESLPTVPINNFYPCPVSCILDAYNNGDEEIIFVSHHNDCKVLVYNVSTNQYKKIINYPKSKFKFHSIQINTKTKQLYIYDGVQPVFMILSIGKSSSHSSDLRVSSKKLIKQHNVIKTGQSFSTLYIQYPYNEYHIIGGTTSNKHYKWNSVAQIFELYSIFTHKKKLCNVQFLFIKKKNIFLIFGGNLNHSMYALKCNNENRIWNKIGASIPFYLYQDYGCILYKDKYIIIFGGNKTLSTANSSMYNNDISKLLPQKWGLMDDIFICCVNNGFKWYEAMLKCPDEGRFHAIYLKYSNKIHLFKRFDKRSKHWQIYPESIIKNENDNEKKEDIKNNDEDAYDEDDNDDLYDVALPTLTVGNNDNIQIQLNQILHTMNEMKTDISVLKQKILILELERNKNDNDIVNNDNYQLKMWLDKFKLVEYYSLFVEQGFGDNIQLLSTLTDDDMQSIGINKLAHRKLLLTQIKRDYGTCTNTMEGY